MTKGQLIQENRELRLRIVALEKQLEKSHQASESALHVVTNTFKLKELVDRLNAIHPVTPSPCLHVSQ